MAPPDVKRTYVTRRKEAELLKKSAKVNRTKKRSRDPCSDDDSSPSQTLGSFELGSSEIQIIPPWSDDDEVNGEEGGDGVEFLGLGRMDVGRCSGVKKYENFAKNVSVIDIDTSDEEEEEKMNEEPCSSYGSVVSLFDDEELDNSDDEDYQCEKIKDQKGNAVTRKYTCRKDLSLDESYCVDKSNGRKDNKGRDGEESAKGKKKGGKVLILDESNGSSEGDSVVMIWPKEDAFNKKKGSLP